MCYPASRVIAHFAPLMVPPLIITVRLYFTSKLVNGLDAEPTVHHVKQYQQIQFAKVIYDPSVIFELEERINV